MRGQGLSLFFSFVTKFHCDFNWFESKFRLLYGTMNIIFERNKTFSSREQ